MKCKRTSILSHTMKWPKAGLRWKLDNNYYSLSLCNSICSSVTIFMQRNILLKPCGTIVVNIPTEPSHKHLCHKIHTLLYLQTQTPTAAVYHCIWLHKHTANVGGKSNSVTLNSKLSVKIFNSFHITDMTVKFTSTVQYPYKESHKGTTVHCWM